MALAGPFALPLLILAISWGRAVLGKTSPSAGIVELLLVGSLLYAGIIYLGFFIVLQTVLCLKPSGVYRRMSWFAPPAFLLVFLVGFQIYWTITGSGSWLESPRVLITYTLVVLFIGYLYITLTWITRALYGKLGYLS